MASSPKSQPSWAVQQLKKSTRDRQGLVLCARHARALPSQERDCSPGAPIRQGNRIGCPAESLAWDANERHRLLTPRHCHGGKAVAFGQTAIWGGEVEL